MKRMSCSLLSVLFLMTGCNTTSMFSLGPQDAEMLSTIEAESKQSRSKTRLKLYGGEPMKVARLRFESDSVDVQIAGPPNEAPARFPIADLMEISITSRNHRRGFTTGAVAGGLLGGLMGVSVQYVELGCERSNSCPEPQPVKGFLRGAIVGALPLGILGGVIGPSDRLVYRFQVVRSPSLGFRVNI